MENVQAQFQMLDNFVKEYTMKCDKKIPNNVVIDVNGKVEFRIVNITETTDCLIGEVELINDLSLTTKENCNAQIKIVMGGLFKYTEKNNKEEFEKMLKYNGAPTLSQFIRSYIHTATAVGGMPPIITPMINFVDFFNNSNKKSK